MEIRGSVEIDWEYPNIYPKKGVLDKITISLEHVRAVDSLCIEFDGDRNGWVIRMDRTVDKGDHSETIEEKVEVAFVPAWNEE